MENEDYEYARRLKILSNGDFYEIERFVKDVEEKRSERIKPMRRGGGRVFINRSLPKYYKLDEKIIYRYNFLKRKRERFSKKNLIKTFKIVLALAVLIVIILLL